MCADKTDLDVEDYVEIERLSIRAKGVSRRQALATAGSALAFIVPALATFTVSPDALGQVGSVMMGLGSPDGRM